MKQRSVNIVRQVKLRKIVRKQLHNRSFVKTPSDKHSHIAWYGNHYKSFIGGSRSQGTYIFKVYGKLI